MCFSGMLLILAVEDESARAEMAVKRENRNRMMEINVSDYSYLGYTEEVMHTSEGCSMGQAERYSERTPPIQFHCFVIEYWQYCIISINVAVSF